MEKCNVLNCDNKVHNRKRGICKLHYQRLMRYGRLHRIKPIGRQECKLENCNESVHGKGLCKIHYDRWYNRNRRKVES